MLLHLTVAITTVVLIFGARNVWLYMKRLRAGLQLCQQPDIQKALNSDEFVSGWKNLAGEYNYKLVLLLPGTITSIVLTWIMWTLNYTGEQMPEMFTMLGSALIAFVVVQQWTTRDMPPHIWYFARELARTRYKLTIAWITERIEVVEDQLDALQAVSTTPDFSVDDAQMVIQLCYELEQLELLNATTKDKLAVLAD